MTTQVLVLGNGHIGRIVAEELADFYRITVVDPYPGEELDERIEYCTENACSADWQGENFKGKSLVVNCLPSPLTPQIIEGCLKAEVPLVDVSYVYPLPDKEVHDRAKRANIPMLFDCGIAPGLTNLFVGRVLHLDGKIENGVIYLGGMATDPKEPFGYSLTWSPEDLLEEYTRPAYYIENGVIKSAPALSEVEELFIDTDRVEAFMTDGLRSLLSHGRIENLKEKTVRWPGHVEAVTPLIKEGKLIETLKQECSNVPDMVLGKICLNDHTYYIEGGGIQGLTAMQESTALTCTAFARLALEEDLDGGVWFPERIGEIEKYYRFVKDRVGCIIY